MDLDYLMEPPARLGFRWHGSSETSLNYIYDQPCRCTALVDRVYREAGKIDRKSPKMNCRSRRVSFLRTEY